MLLEIGISDALGCCFEWTDRWIVKSKNTLRYITLEENPAIIRPGNYTDDTQMSIAIAEAMLEDVEWDHYGLAEKFVECFHRDERRGYAPGFFLFLLNHKNGTDFVHDIRNNSTRSGAAMRAAPLGYLKDINELKEKSYIQSSVTHDTPEGTNSALAVSLAAHYFIYDLGAKKDLLDYLNEHVTLDYDCIVGLEHIPVEGVPCVVAALEAINKHDSLSAIVQESIDYAGDTDTIAAIAGGIASCSKEIKQDLPQNLYDGLEDGPYGKNYLIKLDRELKQKYPK